MGNYDFIANYCTFENSFGKFKWLIGSFGKFKWLIDNFGKFKWLTRRF